METQLPKDATYDALPTPWLTRYIYDATQGQTVSAGTQTGLRAYGNLYKTQEYVGASQGAAAAWNDVSGGAFDALDRQTTKLFYSPGNHTMSATHLAYDATPATYGLLSASTDGLGIRTLFTYDNGERQTQVSYSDGNTPGKSVTFDADGRPVTESLGLHGSEQREYDEDGRLHSVTEAQFNGFTSPATLTYGYYADGARSSLSVSSAALTESNLRAVSYRSDGLPSQIHDKCGLHAYTQTWSYEPSGRPLGYTDNFGITQYTYDASGQPSKWSMPAGALTNITHDAEGNSTGFTLPVTLSNLTQTYSTRGELVQQGTLACVGPTYNKTTPPYASFKVLMANGVRLPQNTCTQYGTKYDSFTGAITKPFDNWANPHFHGVASVALTEQYTFDAAGRLTNAVKTQGSPTVSYTASYDAENRLTGKRYNNTGIAGAYNGTVNYTWGANGHPVQYDLSGTTGSIHWDGDTPLFLTDSSGALLQIFMSPGVSLRTSTAAFTVQDFDWSGSLIAAHGASGSGNLIGTNYFGLGDTEWGPLHANNPIAFTRSDGFILGADTFQGVRTYNATSAQWNSPDAYAGEVGDPMSQKPYMWNRNNPIAYSDPSGYCVEDACVLEVGGTGLAWLALGAVAAAADATDQQDLANLARGGRDAIGSAVRGAASAIEATIHSRLPTVGQPNSTVTRPDGKQTRSYGADGKPIRDVDYGHGHHHAGIGSPHAHDWETDASGKLKRGPARPLTEQERKEPTGAASEKIRNEQ